MLSEAKRNLKAVHLSVEVEKFTFLNRQNAAHEK